jgi:uncharacterized protein YjdB
MAWNEYLHAWNTFAICPFANAVVLATETPIPATAIALPSTESMVVGTDETLTLTLTPANATSDIEFSSSDKTVLTVSKVSNTSVSVHPVAAGTAKVNAVSENGKKSSCTVTVTNS